MSDSPGQLQSFLILERFSGSRWCIAFTPFSHYCFPRDLLIFLNLALQPLCEANTVQMSWPCSCWQESWESREDFGRLQARSQSSHYKVALIKQGESVFNYPLVWEVPSWLRKKFWQLYRWSFCYQFLWCFLQIMEINTFPNHRVFLDDCFQCAPQQCVVSVLKCSNFTLRIERRRGDELWKGIKIHERCLWLKQRVNSTRSEHRAHPSFRERECILKRWSISAWKMDKMVRAVAFWLVFTSGRGITCIWTDFPATIRHFSLGNH